MIMIFFFRHAKINFVKILQDIVLFIFIFTLKVLAQTRS